MKKFQVVTIIFLVSCFLINFAAPLTVLAVEKVDGECGNAISSGPFIEAPTANLCKDGSIPPVEIYELSKYVSSFTWKCSGLNGGVDTYCRVSRYSAACGSANESWFDSTPTGLCGEGAASTLIGTGPWIWLCGGIHGEKVAECSAYKTGNSSCLDSDYGMKYSEKGVTVGLNGGIMTTFVDKCNDNYNLMEYACGYNNNVPIITSSNHKCPYGCSNGACKTCMSEGQEIIADSPCCEGLAPTLECQQESQGASANQSNCKKVCKSRRDGLCGSSHGASFSSIPTSDLCSSGSASSVSGSGPWYWSCAGTNGGALAQCFAYKPATTNGQCGPSHGNYFYDAPTSGLCSSGSASLESDTEQWYWSCTDTNGVKHNCFAIKKEKFFDGVCGSANGKVFSEYPKTNLCLKGIECSLDNLEHCDQNGLIVIITALSKNQIAWACNGFNGGKNVNCFAEKNKNAINGDCGLANGKIFSTHPKTDLCRSGSECSLNKLENCKTKSLIEIILALQTGKWAWTCNGSSGGTDAECSASKI